MIVVSDTCYRVNSVALSYTPHLRIVTAQPQPQATTPHIRLKRSAIYLCECDYRTKIFFLCTTLRCICGRNQNRKNVAHTIGHRMVRNPIFLQLVFVDNSYNRTSTTAAVATRPVFIDPAAGRTLPVYELS